MSRKKMRERFPDDAIDLRCTCGKRLGPIWASNGRHGPDVDAQILVHHKIGRMYRTIKHADGHETRVVNDDDDVWISCPACARDWRGTRQNLHALYNIAHKQNDVYAVLVTLTAEQMVNAILNPSRRW